MKKRPKTKKRGVVEKIIKPPHPNIPEKAQISINDADDLYKEIRVDNVLKNEKGEKVKLKEQAEVDVIIEATKIRPSRKRKRTRRIDPSASPSLPATLAASLEPSALPT